MFRHRDGKDDVRLLISVNEPHFAVSKQTIAKWITNTIRHAYGDEEKKVKAHSTRAIGTSCALFNGASMKSIMEAADWSKQSTFVRFYLKKSGNTCPESVDIIINPVGLLGRRF